MKKSTTTIETCRTELTLTLWDKGNKETYKQTAYVFTPKVPITIETAEKLVKQKHYLLSLSTTLEEDYERLNDSIVLDIALGGHTCLRREFTADEWYYSGCAVKPLQWNLVRNVHNYTVTATVYDRDSKSVIEKIYFVKSFRSLKTDTIKKQVESEIDGRCVLLEMDTDNVKEEEIPIYVRELSAYSCWC